MAVQSQLRIAHLTYSLGQGGTERGIIHLVNRLPADRFRQIVICLTEPTDLAGEITNKDARVYRLQKRAGNDPLLIPRLRRLVVSEEINILHGRGWPTLVEGFVGARSIPRCRFVYGYHGKTYDELVRPKRRRALTQRVLLPWVDAVVAVSSNAARTWCQEVGLPIQRVTVICNGVELTPPVEETERARIRLELGIPVGHQLIGSVGRIDPVKDYPTLLKALALLCRSGMQAVLVLAGDGPGRDALEREARALRVERAVRFLGNRRDIPRLLSIFDVFVQPSLSEAMSNALLEAMGTGVPVVATAVGGTLDIVVDGANGYLVPPSDPEPMAIAISRLLRNEDHRRTLAAAARATVAKHYSLDSMMAGYAALYERLAAGKRQTPITLGAAWPSSAPPSAEAQQAGLLGG